jgi:hypothetical protein
MSTTINLTLAANSDDDYGSAAVGLQNSAVDYAGQIAGFNIRYYCRYTNVTIPAGSTIDSATFSAVAVDTDASTSWITKIHANAADNPSAPANGSALDALALTTAFTSPTNNLSTTSGVRYNFDVTSVVQEIVNRGGWSSGNALMIVWVNNGSTTGRRWNDFSGSGAANASKLDITYSDPPPGNPWNYYAQQQ